MITVNKDFWPPLGKIKEYPSVEEDSIDAYSDANGHNGTNLVINWIESVERESCDSHVKWNQS